MSMFTTAEKICLHITNLVFWLCVHAVVDSFPIEQDAVSLVMGSIVVSTIYTITQEVNR